MKPQKQKIEYEKIDTNDFVKGEIETVQYDQNHKFKGYQGQEDRISPAVRFKFKIENYKFPHYSKWMSFSYGEKANLYLKFLSSLVEGSQPDMDFDLDLLTGMKVKMLWTEKNGFQNIETIRPLNGKIKFTEISNLPEIQMDEQDEVPEIDMEADKFRSPEYSGDPEVNDSQVPF